MPIHVRMDRATGVVELEPQPPVGRGLAEELLQQVIVASKTLPRCRLLIDGRTLDAAFDVGSLWHLAAGLSTMVPRVLERIAVLATADCMPQARFFVLSAQNRAINARAFDDYDQALKWLNEPDWERSAANMRP